MAPRCVGRTRLEMKTRFTRISNKRSACVDVIIAARDRSDTIERAVRSALSQPNVRTVIVIDDGSTDDTAAVASRCDLNDDRLIVRSLPENRGPSAARNTALDISTAPWICVLDGDDYLLPGRIAKLLAAAADRDFVADDLLQVDEQRIGCEAPVPVLFGGSFQPRLLDLLAFVRGNIRPHGVDRRELGFLKPLIRRAFVDRHRLQYDESLRTRGGLCVLCAGAGLGRSFPGRSGCGLRVRRPPGFAKCETQQAGSGALARQRHCSVSVAARVR